MVDLSLVAAAQSSPTDPRGELLLIELAPFLRNVCRKLRVSPALLEDAMQEAALAVLEALPAFDWAKGVPFEGYCYPRVLKALISLLKREGRWNRRHAQLDQGRMESMDLREIAPSVYSASGGNRVDDELLDFLEPSEREVISRHYCQGQDAGEIAAAIGVTRRRVRQILQDGIATLRLLTDCSGSDLAS